ncbi:MAG: hypothetical protein CSA23_08165 [Deltaproteobacteria bacterium]|nr:MAG: hypothetical protein CSA23_08165 [Deltaproteobacteria bacterium]
MKQLYTGIILAAFAILTGHGAANAHKVTIFAWAEGDRVYTESKFSGGKRVKGGTVTVFDREGNRLLEGQTDDQGGYSFKKPTTDGLIVKLNAGMGHANTWELSPADLGAPGKRRDQQAPDQMVSETPSVHARRADAGGLTAADVEAIVARQLEQKLRPLTRMLASVRNTEPTMGDIVGGLGYILGLVGLGTYVRYRKEVPPS